MGTPYNEHKHILKRRALLRELRLRGTDSLCKKHAKRWEPNCLFSLSYITFLIISHYCEGLMVV